MRLVLLCLLCVNVAGFLIGEVEYIEHLDRGIWLGVSALNVLAVMVDCLFLMFLSGNYKG